MLLKWKGMSFAITFQKQQNTFHTWTFYKKRIASFRPIEKLRYTPNMKKHIGMVSVFTLKDVGNDGVWFSIQINNISILHQHINYASLVTSGKSQTCFWKRKSNEFVLFHNSMFERPELFSPKHILRCCLSLLCSMYFISI